MIIDCHAHLIPKRVLGDIGRGRYSYISSSVNDTSLRFKMDGLQESPPAPGVIAEREAFVAWQDHKGIELQVVGPWTDLFGYTLSERDAGYWCQAQNEALAEECSATPRLAGLGQVPLQDPKGAVKALGDALGLGLKGVMIGTSTPNGYLGDPGLDPFWEAAAGTGCPVFVHPIFLVPQPQLDAWGLRNAIGRANETQVAISQILLAGVLHRYPALRLVVSHGGAGLPYLLARLERNHELNKGTTYSPTEVFGQLFFDSVVLSSAGIESLLGFISPRQLMLGSDFPFPWETDPVSRIRDANLSPQDERAVSGGNAATLFGV